MEMTIRQYLENPYGKGFSVTNVAKQRKELENDFIKIKDKIACKVYKYRDYAIFHVVVPSSSKDTVNYDVIVEVELKKLHEGAATIEDLPFKVFSNCPSFIYTYANVFKQNKMLCEWLISKYRNEVKKLEPVYRNRYNMIGYERSLYMAFRFLHVTGRTGIASIQTTGIKSSSRNAIVVAVRSQDQIMENVKAKIKKDPNEKVTIAGKDAKFGSKQLATNINRESNKKNKVTNETRETKKVGKVKVTKKVKTLKKIKKI